MQPISTFHSSHGLHVQAGVYLSNQSEHSLHHMACMCRRGKKGNKHYTVFVAAIDEQARATWSPELNEEHHEARWFSASEAAALPNLHPVVDQLFHKEEFQASLTTSLAS